MTMPFWTECFDEHQILVWESIQESNITDILNCVDPTAKKEELDKAMGISSSCPGRLLGADRGSSVGYVVGFLLVSSLFTQILF